MYMTLKLLIIADNNQVLRFGLQLILDQSSDLAIKEEAMNGDDLLKEITASQYNILLFDLMMQGKDSVAVLKEVKSKWPQIPLVIFTIDPGNLHSARMVRSGAFAQLKRKTNPGNIGSILRSLGNIKKFIFPYQADMLADMLVFLENPVFRTHEQTIGRKLQRFIQPAVSLKKSDIRGIKSPVFKSFPFCQDHGLTILNFN